MVANDKISTSDTYNNKLLSHWNHFTLWTIRSHSLGVNLVGTSPAYKYFITSKFKWMSRALLPFGSSLSLWKFPPPLLPWGTSLEHPNKVHMYVKACHPGIAFKSTSPCCSTPMVSSLKNLGSNSTH